MTTFVSLQGSMAVGKTTVLKYLPQHNSEVVVSYEENRQIIAEIQARRLNKTKFEDFITIQRLFIQNELTRYAKHVYEKRVVMDFGSEEIEFYTLNYPLSKGLDWPVADALTSELDQLKAIQPKRILYLRASLQTLRRRMKNDATRDRGFFETYVATLLPLKEAWFSGNDWVDFLGVDDLSAEELGDTVQEWVTAQLD